MPTVSVVHGKSCDATCTNKVSSFTAVLSCVIREQALTYRSVLRAIFMWAIETYLQRFLRKALLLIVANCVSIFAVTGVLSKISL